jgi:hypothetical protein
MNFAMPSMTRSRVACSAGVRCSFGVSLILRSAPTTALVSWSGSAHSAQARPASNSVRGTSASMRSRRSRLAGERGCDSGRCDEKRAKDVLMCVEDVVCGPSCRSNEASRKVEARLSTWVSLTGGPGKKGGGRAESRSLTIVSISSPSSSSAASSASVRTRSTSSSVAVSDRLRVPLLRLVWSCSPVEDELAVADEARLRARSLRMSDWMGRSRLLTLSATVEPDLSDTIEGVPVHPASVS